MATKNRKELYDLFRTGNKPTQDDFADIIDSMVNIVDDGIGVSERGRPLEIVHQGTKQRFLDLSSAKDQPVWRIGAQSNTGVNGLNVTTADDKSRLFVKREDGSIGINNENPQAKLHITPDHGLALQVDDNQQQTAFVIDSSGKIGIGTTIQDNFKVAIDGKVNLRGETVLSSPVHAENGITVSGAKIAAERGINVKNGATVETGLLEAKDGMAVSGKALTANAGATVRGLPLDAQNGLIVEKGARIENGSLEAKAGLVVNGGAVVESGRLEAKEGLSVEEGAVISSGTLEVREELRVQGPTTFSAPIVSDGLLTAKGGVVVPNGSSFNAEGRVVLGNTENGQVDVNGELRVRQGIIVEDSKFHAQAGAVVDGSELRVNEGLTVHNGAAFETGVLTAAEGITLPSGSVLNAGGTVLLGNEESGAVTINGELEVNNEVTINGGTRLNGNLLVPGHATIDTLDVTNFNFDGTFKLDSSEVNKITAQNGEITDLSVEDLDVSGQCLMADNVVFDSGMISVIFEGPSSMAPKVKLIRGILEESGHFGITVSEDKLVMIVYDDESDINNFLGDWEAYRTAYPANSEGINFIRLGTSSWQLTDMEIKPIPTGTPFKEHVLEEQGLRLLYTGSAAAPQFEIIPSEEPESTLFEFIMEEGKLTIIYPADPAISRVDDLIGEWENWVVHHRGNTAGFEIIKIDDSTGDVLVTRISPTVLRVNTAGHFFAKAMIKTNTVTVNGYLKFADYAVPITGASMDDDLVENSDALLPTQKAVKTYVDKGLALKADQAVVAIELEKKADQTYVATELMKKADLSFVTDELNKKADQSFVTEELAKKADLIYVDAKVAEKADQDYVVGELENKADQNFVVDELVKKANLEYVNTKLAEKANQDHVTQELEKKADRAELSQVTEELEKKVDLSTMVTALATKVNLETAENLSVTQGASVTVDGIGLSSERSGLLLVTITGVDYARTGLFALDGTESLIKMAGDGLSDRPDEPETCNVYLHEGTLMLQNALPDEITAKVIYFGT